MYTVLPFAAIDGEIVGPCCTGVGYEVPPDAGFWRSWCRSRLRWAARELIFARPLECVQGWLFRPHSQVSLPPL